MEKQFFRFLNVGLLRSLIIITAVVLSLIGNIADPNTYHRDTATVITSIVSPSLVVMLLFTFMLDIFMSIVYHSDSSTEERSRYKRIIFIDIICVIMMVCFWSDFISKLFL